MLAEGRDKRYRWRLWVTVVLLGLVAALAFIWPDPGVGERVPNTQIPAQDVVWRQCNPTAEAMRSEAIRWDIPTPSPTPRNYMCDCILTQMPTPWAIGTPIQTTD
jgi:hypothetical protein